MTDEETKRRFLFDAKRIVYDRILDMEKPARFQALAKEMDMPDETLKAVQEVTCLKAGTEIDSKDPVLDGLSGWEIEREFLIVKLKNWLPPKETNPFEIIEQAELKQ